MISPRFLFVPRAEPQGTGNRPTVGMQGMAAAQGWLDDRGEQVEEPRSDVQEQALAVPGKHDAHQGAKRCAPPKVSPWRDQGKGPGERIAGAGDHHRDLLRRGYFGQFPAFFVALPLAILILDKLRKPGSGERPRPNLETRPW